MRVPDAKTRTLDDNTYASHPGLVRLSEEKLRRMHPELFLTGWRMVLLQFMKPMGFSVLWWRTHVAEHLINGDSRAAVVMQTTPLLIAAYTDEFDCVAMLHFPRSCVPTRDLQPGTRLLTVNTYTLRMLGVARDLTPGPGDCRRYGNFAPLIAEFLSDDEQRITERKAQIDEAEWNRTWSLGQNYLKQHGLKARDGRPMLCLERAKAVRS